jgi:hypothetical protein
MLLKTEKNDNKLELSFRPINDPVELQEELHKTEKIDIVITLVLYAIIAAIAIIKIS